MTAPAAKGERFLAMAGPSVSLLETAQVLRARMGVAGRRAPRHQLPDWLARVLGLAVPQLRAVRPLIGRYCEASADKARRLLGWTPRSNEDAIVATAESLLELGVVKREFG